MEIVIKIPEKMYEDAKNGKDTGESWYITQVIKQGTPLPKGHGRLGDLDALKISRTMALVAEKNAPKNQIAFAPLRCVLKENIDNAKTIVEADKESEA